MNIQNIENNKEDHAGNTEQYRKEQYRKEQQDFNPQRETYNPDLKKVEQLEVLDI